MGKVFLYLTQNLSFKFIVFLTFIITGYLRFAHESFPLIRDLDKLISKYGYLVDIGFLVSVGIILVAIFFYAFKLLRKWSVGIRKFLEMSGRIGQLTPSEQAVLREFQIQHNEIVYMPFDDPVVKILINDGFIRFVSDILKVGHIPVQPTKNYKRYFKRELIGIPEDNHDLLIDRNSRFPLDLMRKRPKWTDNYYRQNFL
jgi:hypothetical protein